jgi:hypothetical protein
MVRREYLTARRLAAIREQMQPVDWKLLENVGRLNVASGNQLRRLHYQDSETGRRMSRLHLRRLVEIEVLPRLGRTVGGVRAGSEGHVYALGMAGQRLLYGPRKRARPPWTPSGNSLRHALGVAELYVRLKELEADRQIVLEAFDAEPRSWREYVGPGGMRSVLKPDAYVATGTDEFIDSWFVEVDRATEATTRIASKCRAYWLYWQSGREQAEQSVFPTVLFVVPNRKRREQLAALIASLPAEQRKIVQVVTMDAAPKAMATGELITTND